MNRNKCSWISIIFSIKKSPIFRLLLAHKRTIPLKQHPMDSSWSASVRLYCRFGLFAIESGLISSIQVKNKSHCCRPLFQTHSASTFALSIFPTFFCRFCCCRCCCYWSIFFLNTWKNPVSRHKFQSLQTSKSTSMAIVITRGCVFVHFAMINLLIAPSTGTIELNYLHILLMGLI